MTKPKEKPVPKDAVGHVYETARLLCTVFVGGPGWNPEAKCVIKDKTGKVR